MPSGPGKYSNQAQAILDKLDADAVVLCVVNGKNGCGFDIVYSMDGIGQMLGMPEALRAIADEIELELGSAAVTE